MKQSKQFLQKAGVMLLAVFFVAAWSGEVMGQTVFEWRSEAANGNWHAPTHWWIGSASSAGFGVMRFNNNHFNEMTNNNGGSTFSTHAIHFNSGNTSVRTIGGDPIQLFDFGGSDPYILNTSSATHIINANLSGDGDPGDPLLIQINSTGGLTFGGTIDNMGSRINVEGTTPFATTVAFNNTISGSGGLFKANDNITLDLAGSNTYSGITTFQAGTLRVGSLTALGTGKLVIESGGGATRVLSTIGATGTNIANNIDVFNNLTIGQPSGGTGSLNFTGDLFLGNEVGETRIFTTYGTQSFEGNIAGSRGIVKQGPGSMDLYETNKTFTGPVFIDNGFLTLSNVTIGSPSIDLGTGIAGAQSPNDVHLSIPQTNLNITQNINVRNVGETVGTRTISFGMDSGAGTTTLSGNLLLEKDLILSSDNPNRNLVLSGNITGAGGIINNHSGTLTLDGADNTFSGLLNISTGTVVINSSLENASIESRASLLTLNGSEEGITIRSLTSISTPVQINGEVRISERLSTFGTSIPITINDGATLVIESGAEFRWSGSITYNGSGTIRFERNFAEIAKPGNEEAPDRRWRLLSSPVEVSYADLLSNIWTQGGTGANTTAGESNVFTADGSTSADLARNNVTDFTQNITPGQGFAVYVFESDFETGNRSEWPKVIQATGQAFGNVTFTPAISGGDFPQYAIAGNPFGSSVLFPNLSRGSGVADKVWVYDTANDAVISRGPGDTGDFNGLIASFQGFWIEYAEANRTITFNNNARRTGGEFYGKEQSNSKVVLDFNDGQFSNSAWVVFNEDAQEGYDNLDVVQFGSMSGVGAMLYTIVDDKSMDINYVPSQIDGTLDYPLGFYSSVGGELTISVREMQLPENVIASIVNTRSGEVHQLEDDFKLVFNAPRSKQRSSEEGSLIASAFASEFVLRFSNPSVTSAPLLSDLPTTLHLSQNFPNPFNPTTNIRYNVPENTHVHLAVYNTLGQQVAVLVDGAMSAGSHTATFDASSLSSGVYVYRIEAAGQVLSKRMTLVK